MPPTPRTNHGADSQHRALYYDCRNMEPSDDDDLEFRWRALDPDAPPPPLGVIREQPEFWTDRDPHPDPIGDLREAGASVFLERPLDEFERIVVRSGLTTGFDFPR